MKIGSENDKHKSPDKLSPQKLYDGVTGNSVDSAVPPVIKNPMAPAKEKFVPPPSNKEP